MTELTVGSGFARGLLEFALARGADRQALIERSGIAPDALRDQDRRLPFSSYVALMRAAKALTGDPALALHYGEAVDIAEVSIVGLIGQASLTIMEAFAQVNRYVGLIVETENAGGGPRFLLTRDRAGLWLIDTREDAAAFPELTESAFAQLACGPRRFDDTPFLTAVHVTHADPGYRDEYERIFRAPVTFDAERNGLLIDEGWIGHKVELLPRYAAGVLGEHADALLEDLESARSVRGQVERLLIPRLQTGEAGMETVAARLGVSRQTLFRRLRAEGVTFAAVLDEVRRRAALRHLSRPEVSVSEAAYLVGFSDPAAFSRAFKRWTGTSPGARRASEDGR